MVEAKRDFEEATQKSIVRLSQKTQAGHMNAFFGHLDEFIPVNGFNLFLSDQSQRGEYLPFDKHLEVVSKANPYKFFLKMFARSEELGKMVVGLKYAGGVEVVLTTLTPDKMFLSEAESKTLFDQVSIFSKMAAKGELDPDWEKHKLTSTEEKRKKENERTASAMLFSARSGMYSGTRGIGLRQGAEILRKMGDKWTTADNIPYSHSKPVRKMSDADCLAASSFTNGPRQ